MLKKIFLLIFPLIVLHSCGKKSSSTNPEPTSTFDYETSWKTAESLESKGLQKDLIQELDEIINASLSDERPTDLFKALAIRAKNLQQIEEDAAEKLIQKFEEKIKQAEAPSRALLQSALAELYFQYYQSQRWKIDQRTNYGGKEKIELAYWSREQIRERGNELYLQSLQNAALLDKVSAAELSEILIQNEFKEQSSPNFSLLDVLAERSLQHFRHPAIEGKLYSAPEKVEALFADRKAFIENDLELFPNESDPAYCFNILQSILRQKESQKNFAALLHFDLLRLEIARSLVESEAGDEPYVKVLYLMLKNEKNKAFKDEIRLELAQFYFQKDSLKKALDLSRQRESVNTYGGSHLKELELTILKPQHSITVEKLYPSNESIRFAYRYKNLSTLYLKVIKLDDYDFEHPLRNDREWIRKMIKRDAIEKRNIELKSDTAYRDRQIELELKELDPGEYLLIGSDQSSFELDSAYITISNFKVSNIAYLSRQTDQGHEFIFRHRKSGEILNEVEVDFYKSVYDPTERKNEFVLFKRLKNDSKGRVQLGDLENHRNIQFKIKWKEDKLIPRQSIHWYPNQREEKSRSSIRFFTDRGIYRPGQTLYFKAILYEENGKERRVKVGQKKPVKLFDPNGELINEKEFISNEFGSIAGKFILSGNALNGNYRLASDNGSYYFKVEEYRRPSIRIVEDSSLKIIPNKQICFNGQVQTYTGIPLNQARIKYKIIRQSIHFPRPYFSSYFPPSEKRILINEERDLDDHRIEICFQPDSQTDQRYQYTLELSVIGPLGETVSTTKLFNPQAEPYQWKADFAKQLTTDELNQLKLFAIDRKGRFLAKTAKLKLWRLESPTELQVPSLWEETSSNQNYRGLRNDYQLKHSKQQFNELDDLKKAVLISSMNYRSGESIASFNELKAGAYRLELIDDLYGEDKAAFSRSFRLYGSDRKTPPFPEFFWFDLKEDSLIIGQKPKLSISSSLNNLPLLVEVEFEEDLVFEKQLSIQNEIKTVAIDLPKKVGNGFIHLSGISHNRVINHQIPFSISEPEPPFELFMKRSTQLTEPGKQENWTVGVRNLKSGEELELMGNLYDASLEKLAPLRWNTSVNESVRMKWAWQQGNNFGLNYHLEYPINNPIDLIQKAIIPRLNWFGFYLSPGRMVPFDNGRVYLAEAAMQKSSVAADEVKTNRADQENEEIEIRKDFRETAFFYPQLSQNDQQEFDLSFKMPDGMGEWKFNGLAHDKNFSFSKIDQKLISRKPLMVKSFLPRFYRAGDEGKIKVEISNLTASEQNISLTMNFQDSEGNPLDVLESSADRRIQLKANSNEIIDFVLKAPQSPMRIKYQIIAKGDKVQDAFEDFIPILSNKSLVSKSFPFEAKAGESVRYQFKHFAQEFNSVANNHLYKVEYTSDPRWLAVAALPSLINENEDCPEKVFQNLYSLSLATYTAKQVAGLQDYLSAHDLSEKRSELDRNQELKSLKLEQTPWKSAAEREREQRQGLAELFNENQTNYRMQSYLDRLKELQLPKGAWPWFKGMKANQFISQNILIGLAKLRKLEVFDPKENKQIELMSRSAYVYLDEEVEEQFERLKRVGIKEEQDYLSPQIIHYLYCRSFDQNWKPNAAAAFYLEEVEQHWNNKNPYLRSLIALSEIQKNPNSQLSSHIFLSIKNIAIRDSLGIHWQFENQPYWYASKLIAQSTVLELYQTIASKDEDIVQIKKWLLHQKNQQMWPGDKASSEACFALLNDGSPLVMEEKESVVLVGDENLVGNESEIPGVKQKSWEGGRITERLAQIEVNQSKKTFGWGAAHWQYYQQIDEIKASSLDGFQINSKYYQIKVNANGREELIELKESELEVGSLIRQRVEIETNYYLDFVLLKHNAPACLESVEQLSGTNYRDGISYYGNLKDSEQQYFIEKLGRGKYVLEFDYRLSQSGIFKGGSCELSSYYAPEFNARSKGSRLKITD